MKHRFSLTLPSCGSCVSHSHCKECMEGVGRALSALIPVESFRTEPGKKELTVDTSLESAALVDHLDDMGIIAEEI